MKYLERTLERKFLRMSSFFKAVLVTGARQVGKTTMLKHLAAEQARTYVSMDNIMARTLAKSDPVLFFQTYKPPIIIDEIQKAPELFEQIKIMCDESAERGRFWLTGSQQYNMMRNIRETLAGRVGILELYSLSKNEVEGLLFPNELDFSLPCFLQRQSLVKKNDIVDVFEHIWRGGMPDVLLADAEQRQEYFNSYIETYLMRDVSEAGAITDTVRFRKFLSACAALVAEQVNYKTLADAAEISQPTAKEWGRLLQGLGIIYLLQPYANNELKRLTKTPKLYFCDTGLCAYLSMWLTRDTLMNGAASGHYFENYVVIELLKNFAYAPSKATLTYYRDSNAKEIDVFVEQNGVIHPLEIKKSANPDRREVKKYELLDKVNVERGSGGIICMCEEVIPIDAKNCFIPCNLI
ncbi:MAG: ATP-binding protein [Phascolarctobacterium sp.]|uniref:ATP-binding protein n=1 Tax=Phascolarctobacterium sp. TaxID=2049039 RepID=UPI0026DCD76E|nr:ATP-binding protein [Phascolarctobacterium sp.]MDO4921445.1 ATP-binding protein [Phascolarctobacterium sp.]